MQPLLGRLSSVRPCLRGWAVARARLEPTWKACNGALPSASCSATQRRQETSVGEPPPCPHHPQGVSDTVPARSITLRLPQGSGGGLHPGHVHKANRNSPFSLWLGQELSDRHRVSSGSRARRRFSGCKGEGHRSKSRSKPSGAALAARQPGTALGRGAGSPTLVWPAPTRRSVWWRSSECSATAPVSLSLHSSGKCFGTGGWRALEESWVVLVGCLTSVQQKKFTLQLLNSQISALRKGFCCLMLLRT